VPWPEARGSSSGIGSAAVGDTRLLLLAWTGLVLVPFWSIEMVVSAFARVVLTCLRSRSRQASCLELCNPQHPSTTL
jgi:hypothetical protein